MAWKFGGGMRLRVVGIQLDGSTVLRNRGSESLWRILHRVRSPLKIRIIRRDIWRNSIGCSLYFFLCQLDCQCSHDLLRDRILQREHICHRSVVAFRP